MITARTIYLGEVKEISKYPFRNLDKSFMLANAKGEQFVIGADIYQNCCEDFYDNLDEVYEQLKKLHKKGRLDTLTIRIMIEENSDLYEAGGVLIAVFSNDWGDYITLHIHNYHNGYYGHEVTYQYANEEYEYHVF